MGHKFFVPIFDLEQRISIDQHANGYSYYRKVIIIILLVFVFFSTDDDVRKKGHKRQLKRRKNIHTRTRYRQKRKRVNNTCEI